MAKRTTENHVEQKSDLLCGMNAICEYLRVSAPTVLKWVRELDLPCRKTQINGGGSWISSKSMLDDWSKKIVSSKNTR